MADSVTDLTTFDASVTIVVGFIDFVVENGARRRPEKHLDTKLNWAE